MKYMLHIILKKPIYPISGVKYINVNLLEISQCMNIMENIDIVIMCAAYVGGIAAINCKPLDLLNNSTRINLNTLEAAYENGIKKCIFISSGAVYPKLNCKAKEEYAFIGNPIEKYYVLGWTKRFGEILCNMYAEKVNKKIDITVLRIDNIYGPYDTFEGNKAHVIPSLIKKVVNNDDPILVWGNGEEKKDFLYVEDLVEAILLCIKRTKDFNCYNVVSGKNRTINEVLQMIMDICNSKNNIKYDLSKPTSISERNLDNSKIRFELGFKSHTELYDGLVKTILWYKKEHKINIGENI